MMKKLVHPGDTVLDIGAHIGYHALALARLVGDNGKVIALEPDPVNFSLLEKNIRVNQYSNVTAFRTKISGRTSDAANGSDGGSISTGAITVDDFVHDRLNDTVDLIQFDVDGRECFAPQGMPSTLKKDALILLAEHDPAEVRIMGYDPERDFAFLRSNGFEIYSLHDRSNGIAKVTDVRQMAGKNLICIKGRRKTLLER
jgi:FkbM family methyltransferase